MIIIICINILNLAKVIVNQSVTENLIKIVLMQINVVLSLQVLIQKSLNLKMFARNVDVNNVTKQSELQIRGFNLMIFFLNLSLLIAQRIKANKIYYRNSIFLETLT